MSKLDDAREAILDYIIEAAKTQHGGSEVRNLAGAYEALNVVEPPKAQDGR